jgi:hypothetical protein
VQLPGDIVLAGPLIGITDRQVVLGAMARALGTLATRLSTGEVAFDERAAEDAWVEESHPCEEGHSFSA